MNRAPQQQISHSVSILSDEMREDTKLKLSVKDFYDDLRMPLSEDERKIDDGSAGMEFIMRKSLEEMNSQRIENSPQRQRRMEELRNTSPYPNDFVFASLAERCYGEKENVIRDKPGKENLHGEPVFWDWRLLTGAYHNVAHQRKKLRNAIINFKSSLGSTVAHKATDGQVGDPTGYFGAAYWNPRTRQVIIAHRGTESPADLGTDWMDCIRADIKGVLSNKHIAQIDSAVTFTDKVLSAIRKINEENGLHIQLFVTGHSLGAWLASITAFSVKYLQKRDGLFIASTDFEETGYHASAVIFDGPGCRRMLERIQDRLMNRSSPSLIDSLDIRNYLSAPNIVNACHPQVGDKYRIFIDLSEHDKQLIRNWDIQHLVYTFGVTHKMCNIKGVFEAETGEVLKDKEGNLKIKKVIDWPLLLPKNPSTKYLEKIGNSYAANLLLAFIPEAGLLLKTSRMIAGFIFNNSLISEAMKWHYEVKKELNEFFELANTYNDFHIEANMATIMVEDNSYRTIRYQTQNLDVDYKCKRILSVFSQTERQFLEKYKLLERYQGLPTAFDLKHLFGKLDDDLQKKAIDLLKECTLEEDGSVCSRSISLLIPYVKCMLHFFPEIQLELEKAYHNFPVDILCGIYQSVSSSYLSSFKDYLEFINDSLNLKRFLDDSKKNCLHIIHSSTRLGLLQLHKTLIATETYYNEDKNHALLNLNRLFYLKRSLLTGFTKDMKRKYLVVVECDAVPIDATLKVKMEEFFDDLSNNFNVKVILITEKNSEFGRIVRNCNKSRLSYQEKTIELRFSDLTPESRTKLLEGKTVIFQGNEVPLSVLMNFDKDCALDAIINPETIAQLVKNEEIVIGKPLPSLGETEDYYIDHKLFK